MFQFYLSSIKSEVEEDTEVEDIMFQFYLSSIKSICALSIVSSGIRFNSTLVQLKVKR